MHAYAEATFHQNAQVWAGKGRVGVVNDDHLAVWVQQEQRWLRKGLVRLADVAGLCKDISNVGAGLVHSEGRLHSRYRTHTVCLRIRVQSYVWNRPG